MFLTRFQQSAFTLNTASGAAIAVDFGIFSEEVESRSVDACFVSHGHPDHLYIPHLKAMGVPVFGPPDVVEKLALTDLEVPLTVIQPGDEVDVAGIKITAFDSDHGPNLTADIDNLGLTFSADEQRLLYLGDMAVPSEIPSGDWSLIMVPVGGSKVFTPEEAVAFIDKIGHTGRVVPIHFDENVDYTCGDRFRTLAANICDVHLIGIGEKLEV